MGDSNYSLLLPRVERMPRTIAARTRRVYDILASVYPLSTFFFHSKAHACALRHSGIRDGMRVLEVATGSGEMFRRLVRSNPNGADLRPGSFAEHGRAHAAPGPPRVSRHRDATAEPWTSAICPSATPASTR